MAIINSGWTFIDHNRTQVFPMLKDIKMDTISVDFDIQELCLIIYTVKERSV